MRHKNMTNSLKGLVAKPDYNDKITKQFDDIISNYKKTVSF